MLRKTLRILLKTILWVAISVIALLLIITALIRLPSVQTYVVQKTSTFVSSKTHTKVEIGYLGINFPQSVVLKNVFAEDLTHDTLAYIGYLKVNVNMLALFNKTLSVNEVELANSSVKLIRTLPDSTFNFQFIIDAFASGEKKEDVSVDTTASGFKIDANQIKLNEIRFLFADSVNGMSFFTHAGKLELSLNQMSLDTLLFYADDILIENTQAAFHVFKNSPSTPQDTGTSLLPYLALKHAQINNSSFIFTNKPDSSSFGFKVSSIDVSPNVIDLNRELIDIKSLKIENPIGIIAMKQDLNDENKNNTPTSTPQDTSIGWQVNAKNVSLINGAFKMDFTNIPKQKSGMDYMHLSGSQITIDLPEVFYSSRLIKGYLKHVSLKEQCGLDLKKLSTRFVYDDTHAQLASLHVETPKTLISNYIGITYPSISSIGSRLDELGIEANLQKTKVHLSDVLYFAPDLINLPPFNGDANKTITVNGKINGLLNNLNLKNIVITAEQQTALQLDGMITGLPDAEKSWYDIQLKSLSTTQQELNKLVGSNYLPNQINIPDHVMLSGRYTGTFKAFDGIVQLKSTQGHANIAAKVDLTPNKELAQIDGNIDGLDLGYLLKNKMLGKTSANIKADVTNFDQEKMVADAVVQVPYIVYNGYTYTHINLNAQANKGLVKAVFEVKDPSLNVDVKANGNLQKNNEKADIILTLNGADLKKLGFNNKELRIGANVVAHVDRFDLEHMDAYVGIGDFRIASPEYKYTFDSITVNTINNLGKHTLDLKSSIATANFAGSLPFDKIAAALNQHIQYYLTQGSKLPDTLGGNFLLVADVKPHPIFSDFLLPELKKFSGIKINSTYNSPTRELKAKVTTDLVQYGETEIRSAGININSNSESLTYVMGARSVFSGNIKIPTLGVNGNIKNGIIDNTTRVIEKDSGNRLFIHNEIVLNENSTLIKIKDGNITLDNQKWEVPENNSISLSNTGINIQQLSLTRNSNYIQVQSSTTQPNAPIDIKFAQFNIGELSQIIENDTALLRGSLNGTLRIEKLSPFEFISDLRINDLSMQNIALGNLSIKADNQTANRYSANVALKGNGNDAQIQGYYENEQLNLHVKLNEISLKTIEAFVPTQIKEATGFISGNIDINGKATAPNLNGTITFNNASMLVTALNNKMSIAKESITINNTGIHFGRFTIKDQTGQPLVLSGDILTSDFKNMKLNVDVNAKNFTALNTTAANNKVYYGKIIINTLIKIRGTQDLPVIDATLKLIEGSNFTFVVQQGDLSTDIGEDIVQVIDKDTNLFFKFIDTVMATSGQFKGIDLNAFIEVDRRTIFSVIVDPNSGDRLVVGGDANLTFGLDQSGKMSLTGTYVLNQGSYRASIQKVVRKEFFIKSGSRITWTGDPLSAKIDITALYPVRTSASDLMAAEVSPQERNMYRKLLDYEVNLIIQGELLQPELSFAINLTEDDKAAFGGIIESKLNTLNNDPNELNKQVFALLILNKFLPPSNYNATAGGGTSTLARNSVNQIISDQINALGGKLIKGAELNVNIQSNDDYSSAGGTTQQTEVEVGVRKQLFDERLSVQVGGNVNVNDNSPQSTTQQNITGDVVLEYKLGKEGKDSPWKLKAFRENNYEGLIDGMLYKTGIGIIFNKDYDNVKDLFKPAKKEEETTVKPEKKKD